MKKLVIITLGAMFALSLMSGIASEKGEPEKGKADNLFCVFDYCDYKKELVRLECVNPNAKGNHATFYVWSNDKELWDRWCLDYEYE